MIIHTNFEPIFFCIHFIENIVNLIIGLIIYPERQLLNLKNINDT